MAKKHIKPTAENKAGFLSSTKDKIRTAEDYDSMSTENIDLLLNRNNTTSKTIHLFLDTEFTDAESLELISIGIVSDLGHEFYLENSNFDKECCSMFIANEIAPKLIGGEYAMTESKIISKLSNWLLELLGRYDEVKLYIDYYPDLLILDRLLKAFPEKNKLNCIMVDLDHLKDKVNVEERKIKAHYALWDAKDLFERWKFAASSPN